MIVVSATNPPLRLRARHYRTGRLLDIPGEHVAVSGLPKPPAGGAIRRIDVIIRVDRDPPPAAD